MEAKLEAVQPAFVIESPTVAEYVETYFSDMPIMTAVAACESRFRHFDRHGDIVRGEANWQDVGVMQINERFHLETAKDLGYNLYSLEGNVAYARYLFEKEGTRPWNASKPCWGKERLVALQS
ncbi:MAG TPA: hypothetical protein VGA06_00575 [Candidatus Paceibacterota bacterium]|jgi:hypothetical protein